MSRPRKTKSIENASAPTEGEGILTGGRITVSLFVIARNLDDANDTVEVNLEASVDDGQTWADIERLAASEKATIQISDMEDHEGDGTYTAFLSVQGIAADHVRAHATNIEDAADGDLSVDAWVSVSNNPRGTQSYREV